jgi:hypothetical protein
VDAAPAETCVRATFALERRETIVIVAVILKVIFIEIGFSLGALNHNRLAILATDQRKRQFDRRRLLDGSRPVASVYPVCRRRCERLSESDGAMVEVPAEANGEEQASVERVFHRRNGQRPCGLVAPREK